MPSSDRKLADISAAVGGVSYVDPTVAKRKLKEVCRAHYVLVFLYLNSCSFAMFTLSLPFIPYLLESAYEDNISRKTRARMAPVLVAPLAFNKLVRIAGRFISTIDAS